jgi:GT2 family glycosyltransferase
MTDRAARLESIDSALGHSLRRAAWLSGEVLLLASGPQTASREREDPSPPSATVAARAFVAPAGKIFAAAPPAGLLERPGTIAFVDEARAETATLDAGAGFAALTDLRTLLREFPAAWEAGAREALLGFLASLGGEHGLSDSLSAGLRLARQALRERRPLTIDDRHEERGVAVERLHRVEEDAFYLRGRAWDGAAPLATIAVTTPEGERVELLETAFRDPDLDGGFICFFRTTAPTRCREDWVAEVASGPGRAAECSAALAPDALDTILADAALELATAEALREHHLMPAASAIFEQRRADVAVAGVEAYGSAPPAPPVSVVVPLQRRVDLVEHQLAQFAADPAFGDCELIYVLDDPDQADLLDELAGELFQLYGLPFRVATLTGAGGAAIACNLGASLASADRLVILGSDVLPDRPGWLGAMAAALDADSRAGAVAPKLLFEDEAIDHAGLSYRQMEGCEGWRVEHRLRGFHRSVAAANRGGPVVAAGLACLMVDGPLFHDVGGLSADYGEADYEGADLCRRLAEAGRHCEYAPEAALYRLEGLGVAPEAKGERYARWLHSRRWAQAIERAGRE